MYTSYTLFYKSIILFHLDAFNKTASKRRLKRKGYRIFCKTPDGFYCTTRSVFCKDGTRKSVTLFPRDWSKEKVIEVVFDAIRTGETKKGSNKRCEIFVKNVSDDVSVQVVVDELTGDIVTAYPDLEEFIHKFKNSKNQSKKH